MSRRFSDEEILQAYIHTRSQTETAQILGCSIQTVNTRMKQPAFISKLNECRRECLNTAIQNICQSTEKASLVLSEMLDCDNLYYRYAAAVKVLELSKSYVTLAELKEQMDSMDRKLSESIMNENLICNDDV